MPRKLKRRYWVSQGGDDALRNGSFVRNGINYTTLVQYMNGDYMGMIESVPAGFTEVDQAHAETLIPSICK